MARILDNWLTSYLEYVRETEPATMFQKWVGLAVIGAALRRKTYLSLGRIQVFPNIYVVLVAEPGVARKTQAIKFGLDFIRTIPDIVLSADATTKEALADCLEQCAVEDILLDGTICKHSSLTIISKEFESFLGQKKDNTKMLVFLTDMFDCPDVWEYKTKHSGVNMIPNAYLSILAATTPDSLASSLPSVAIGGGLTSRILFVCADKRNKKVTKPEETEEEKKLKEMLKKDLFIISRIAGEYQFSPEAYEAWDHWYQSYEELDVNRTCKDPSFSGWYSRKPTYIQKIALLCSAAKNSNMTIEWRDVEESIQLIEEVESTMSYAFGAVGRSVVTTEVDQVIKLIQQRKVITEKELLSLTWRDMDSVKFDNIINTVLRSGKAVRKYTGPHGETNDVWYYDSEYMKQLIANRRVE